MQRRRLGDERREVLGHPVDDQDRGPFGPHEVLERTLPADGLHRVGLHAGHDQSGRLGRDVEIVLETRAPGRLGYHDHPVATLVERPPVGGEVDHQHVPRHEQQAGAEDHEAGKQRVAGQQLDDRHPHRGRTRRRPGR